MRPARDGLDAVLKSPHHTRFIADAFHNWDRPSNTKALQLVSGSISHASTAEVRGSGTAVIAHSDAYGRTVTPAQIEDTLSPFGNWLRITCIIESGPYRSETVLGWFEISNPRIGQRGITAVGGVFRVTGETVPLSFGDAFLGTKREEIVGVQQAPVGGSIIAELTALLGIPVTSDIDATVSTLIEYEKDRLSAAYKLLAPIGGTPYMRWDNTVGIRPDAWPAPQGTLEEKLPGNDRGLLSDVQLGEWDASKVYNRVVIETENDDQAVLRAERQINDGRLRYGLRSEGAWGRYTLVEKVQGFTDQEQLNRHADARLAAVSSTRSLGITWSQPFDPRMEDGDVYRVRSTDFDGLVRIRAVDVDVQTGIAKVSGYRG